MRATTARSALFASAAMFLASAPALAQEAPAGPTDTAATAAANDAQTRDETATAPDGEIVVTARRRAETLIDVLNDLFNLDNQPVTTDEPAQH